MQLVRLASTSVFAVTLLATNSLHAQQPLKPVACCLDLTCQDERLAKCGTEACAQDQLDCVPEQASKSHFCAAAASYTHAALQSQMSLPMRMDKWKKAARMWLRCMQEPASPNQGPVAKKRGCDVCAKGDAFGPLAKADAAKECEELCRVEAPVAAGCSTRCVAGWTSLGIGVGLLGGAVAENVRAWQSFDNQNESERHSEVVTSVTLYAIGGTATAVGAALLVWDAVDAANKDKSRSTWMVAPTRSGAVISARW